jgi:divalent metal cation (Fe/Co/Zn/Cd) transporter
MTDAVKHIVSSLVFVAALIFLWNPFGTWMPSELEMIAAGAVAVIAAVFIGLVSTDEGRDEREVALRGKSARVGYIAGVLVLSLCVVVGLVTHEPVNLWILGALGAMVVTRVVHRVM